MNDGLKYCSLFQRRQDWTHWSTSTEKVHGISREIPLANGDLAFKGANRLNKMLHGRSADSDGWVVARRCLDWLYAAASMRCEFTLSVTTHAKVTVGVLLAFLSGGCASTLSEESRNRLDDLVLYGWVNRVSLENVRPSLKSTIGKKLCSRGAYDWCINPDQYTYVSVMFMNTYWGGLKGAGVYAPASQGIQKNDILVLRYRASHFSEIVSVASKGEREGCRWVGGGFARTTTAAGVICEDYDWRKFAPLFN
ncbi:MAG: hypothetical protein ING94_00050 [Rhodocyclaceae bacterium]|nr:hypothetical protein [Rhodocyclaceae bacterium]